MPAYPLYQAIILTIVQGFTEFLPVSPPEPVSMAAGLKDPGLSFDIALHFGTLIAIVVYFFKDWVQVLGRGLGVA